MLTVRACCSFGPQSTDEPEGSKGVVQEIASLILSHCFVLPSLLGDDNDDGAEGGREGGREGAGADPSFPVHVLPQISCASSLFHYGLLYH